MIMISCREVQGPGQLQLQASPGPGLLALEVQNSIPEDILTYAWFGIKLLMGVQQINNDINRAHQ